MMENFISARLLLCVPPHHSCSFYAFREGLVDCAGHPEPAGVPIVVPTNHRDSKLFCPSNLVPHGFIRMIGIEENHGRPFPAIPITECDTIFVFEPNAARLK